MPGYRFCRTDDVPLLVEATNACRGPESAGDAPVTLESWKTSVRELDVWASSCMLALEGSTPIGVMVAAKRAHATHIHALHVAPPWRRQGHGRHMLASLGSKLAILGPPRLLAEVPAERHDLRAFFSACGFEPDAAYADHMRDATAAAPAGPDPAVPITVDELRQAGLLASDPSRAWERAAETLVRRAGTLEGLALGTDTGIEAWLLARPTPPACELVAFGCGAGAQAAALLDILMARFMARQAGPVVIPRVSAAEAGAERLAAWGFRKSREYVRYAASATPA
jgi:GNAT superfamily N-acetyltransferase